MKSIKIDKKTKLKLKKHINTEADEEREFPLPKYAGQFFNLISSNSQATRPKYVGQMSEIIPEFINEYHKEKDKFPDWRDWKEYYLDKHKEEYDNGFERFKEYINKHLDAMSKIINDDDYDLAKNWYDKFILIQNYKGFQYELLILEFIKRELKKGKYYIVRKSTPEEEINSIDIVIENTETHENVCINVKPKASFERINKQKNISFKEDVVYLYYEVMDDLIEITIPDEEQYNRFNNI